MGIHLPHLLLLPGFGWQLCDIKRISLDKRKGHTEMKAVFQRLRSVDFETCFGCFCQDITVSLRMIGIFKVPGDGPGNYSSTVLHITVTVQFLQDRRSSGVDAGLQHLTFLHTGTRAHC